MHGFDGSLGDISFANLKALSTLSFYHRYLSTPRGGHCVWGLALNGPPDPVVLSLLSHSFADTAFVLRFVRGGKNWPAFAQTGSPPRFWNILKVFRSPFLRSSSIENASQGDADSW